MRIVVLVAMLALPAFALVEETTDFWDTTGYIGTAPAAAETPSLAKALESWTAFARESAPLAAAFSSFRPGTFIVVR